MPRKLFKFQIFLRCNKNNIKIKQKKLFKRLKISDELVYIEPNTTYYNAESIFSMGAFSYSRSALPCETIIGRYCSIGSDVKVLRVDHPLDRFTTSTITYCNKSHKETSFKTVVYNEIKSPIIIGHDVWIGAGAKIKQGISIGHGAVLGANSIVTKDVPPYAIVVGSPAKIVKYRFNPEVIRQLIDSEWWNYDLTQIDIPLDSIPVDIVAAIKRLQLKPVSYNAVKV